MILVNGDWEELGIGDKIKNVFSYGDSIYTIPI